MRKQMCHSQHVNGPLLGWRGKGAANFGHFWNACMRLLQGRARKRKASHMQAAITAGEYRSGITQVIQA